MNRRLRHAEKPHAAFGATAPRNGIISGCFPLDPYYKDASEHDALKTKKTEMRKALSGK